MSLSEELISRLRCPETRQSLGVADDATLEKIRERCGREIEAALIRDDGRRAYPIRGGFPILLLDEAIELGA